jgi:hypothetical protein
MGTISLHNNESSRRETNDSATLKHEITSRYMLQHCSFMLVKFVYFRILIS